jgi:Flp pilus assembly protein TadG
LRLWRRGERGTSAVELAFVLPVLLLLILGAVDFGQLVLYHNAVSEAARDGARVGMVRVTPNPTVTAPPVITSAQATAIAEAAREKAGPLGPNATVVATVVGDSYRGYAVRVVVSSQYQPIGLLGGVTNVQVRAGSQINR